MENFFDAKGRLQVNIGEGLLSSFEAASLKVGDVVKTAKIAGNPSSVFFNGNFLCRGTVVIVGSLFGVRVTSLSRGADVEPALSNSDDVVEILPTAVSLGSIRVSLRELQDVGPGTIIGLARPYNEDEDAELIVAGRPLARGKVVVIYEEMGIRLTQVSGSEYDEAGVRTSGYLLERDFNPTYIKSYNFKRPDWFTRNAIDKVHRIHALMLRNLKAMHDPFSDYRVTDVDQCTFDETFDTIGSAEYGYLLVRNLPWQRAYRPGPGEASESSGRTAKLLVEDAQAQHRISQAAREYLEKYVRGDGMVHEKPVFVCYRKSRLFEHLLQDDPQQKALLACMRGGWKNVIDLNFGLIKASDNFGDIQLISKKDMVITVTAADSGNPEGRIHFIYPYLTLEPFINILG